jgi:hypothetical protein
MLSRSHEPIPVGVSARLAVPLLGAVLADYYALIAYAAATLDKNTAASRRLLYERARASLVAQMRRLDPPLTESEIRREQFALEEAIRKLEAEKLSRLAQRDDQLICKLNKLVQKMHQMQQRMPLRVLD